MAFQVMDAQHRLVDGQAQAASDGGTDQQRAGQARTLRVGDGVDLGQGDAGLRQGLFQQRDGAADMVARRQFGHYAAILLVHGDLRIEGVRQQAALRVIQGQAGFVTGGFDAKNNHEGAK